MDELHLQAEDTFDTTKALKTIFAVGSLVGAVIGLTHLTSGSMVIFGIGCAALFTRLAVGGTTSPQLTKESIERLERHVRAEEDSDDRHAPDS